MFDFLERSALIFTEEEFDRLATKTVLVAGLGGVGGSCAEALVRAGIGGLVLLDGDCFVLSNLNRQLFATRDTLDQKKAQEAKKRLHRINPDCRITVLDFFYLPENSDQLFTQPFDLAVDAIDTVAAKLDIIQNCKRRGIPVFSSMGTGNRKNPFLLKSGDISQTAGFGCPLSRIVRSNLKKIGISSLEVVYSTEVPVKTALPSDGKGRHSPGSSSFVPPAAGLMLAYLAVSRLLADGEEV